MVRFLLLDLLLIVAYGVFLTECTRWGRQCFGWAFLRTLCRPLWAAVVALVVVDLSEMAGLLVLRARKVAWVGEALVWVEVAKFALAAALMAVAVAVLITGARRFALPWTVPPRYPPEVDTEARTPTKKPPSEASSPGWFVDHNLNAYPPVPYGIGLSGGGIRSAAFCMGVLQGLPDDSPLSPSNARYLATVSGGGYLGVSSQMLRNQRDPATNRFVVPDPVPYHSHAPESDHLKRKHRYLADNSRDRAQAVIGYVVGVGCNFALVGSILIALGIATWMLFGSGGDGHPTLGLLVASLLTVLSAFIWYAFGSGEASLAKVEDKRPAGWRFLSAALAAAAAASAAAWLPWRSPWWVILLLIVLGVVGWAMGKFDTTGVLRLSRQTVFTSVWAVLCLWAIDASRQQFPGWDLARSDHGWRAIFALMGAVALSLVFAEQTWWSPHPFYKERLAGTFALRRAGLDAIPIAYDQWTYLETWAQRFESGRGSSPELVVCATANLENRSVPPAGTRAVPFVFTAEAVGSPELGWWTAKDFRTVLGARLARDGTLQAAAAISGAAVAARLGSQGRIPSSGTALALFNARLGVWLPNPNQPEKWKGSEGWSPGRSWCRRFRRPHWLLAELLGWLPGHRRFVYVSDGGHLDNLGLLELLRRRCQTILLIDASGDQPGTTDALDNALTLARDHLGVTITRTRCTLAEPAKRTFPGFPLKRTAADCVERLDVTYPPNEDGTGQKGVIILAKAAFSETLIDQGGAINELAGKVAAHQRTRCWWWSMGSIPKTSTMNQFLTDDQFAGYVTLGHAVGEQVCKRLDDEDMADVRAILVVGARDA